MQTERAETSAVDGRLVRRHSEQWCDTNVVVFDDMMKNGDIDKDEKGRLQKKRLSNPQTPFSPDATVAVADTLTLPPAPLSKSKWLRGIPSSSSSLDEKGSPPNASSSTTTKTTTTAAAASPTIDQINSWHFDVLHYPSEALVETFATIMSYYDLPAKYNISVETLNRFSNKVRELHNPDAAYHNWHHGVSCMHASFVILTLGGADAYLTDADIFALLFGSLIHDVDHAGHNNDFEIKTCTTLAAKYECQSVLENHSVDITQTEILACEGCDIFEGMKRDGRQDEMRHIQELAKEFVLATDPAKHAPLIKELLALTEKHHQQQQSHTINDYDDGDDDKTPEETKINQGTDRYHDVWNKNDSALRSLLCRMIIHGADISNPTSPSFTVAQDWCHRISTEFSQQAKRERELGLEVSVFMDGLDDEYRIAKQQAAFYKWMAIPFFAVVGAVLPNAAIMEDCAKKNLKNYEDIVQLVDQWKEVETREKES